MGISRQCVGIRSLRNRWLEGKSDPTLCIGHTTGASERYTGDGTRGTVSTGRVGVTLHRLLVLDTRFTGGWCRAHRDHLSTDQFCRERASRPSECASERQRHCPARLETGTFLQPLRTEAHHPKGVVLAWFTSLTEKMFGESARSTSCARECNYLRMYVHYMYLIARNTLSGLLDY